MNWVRSKEELNGKDRAVSDSVTSENLGWRWVMTGGSHLSAGERKDPVPVREIGKWAAGLFLFTGPKGSRGPFLFFSFSLLFLFS
jgi:hypothetical protein